MTQVEDFILEQDHQTRQILNHLHQLISSYPDIIPKICYKIPFYYRKSWICYLNPLQSGKVELAFPRGNELSNEQGLLQSNGRKQVYGVAISSVVEIPERIIHEIIQEAIILDQEIPYASKRKKKSG